MLRLLRNSKAQSTLEYAILLVVIILALIGIQAYLKRGISGRMKESSDQIGEQFSPGYTTSNYTTTTHAVMVENQTAWDSTTQYQNQWQQRTGSENVGNFEVETYSY